MNSWDDITDNNEAAFVPKKSAAKREKLLKLIFTRHILNHAIENDHIVSAPWNLIDRGIYLSLSGNLLLNTPTRDVYRWTEGIKAIHRVSFLDQFDPKIKVAAAVIEYGCRAFGGEVRHEPVFKR